MTAKVGCVVVRLKALCPLGQLSIDLAVRRRQVPKDDRYSHESTFS